MNNPDVAESLAIMDKYEIVSHAHLEFPFRDRMGLSNKIKEHITAIGWENGLINNVDYLVYRELCLEFYSTLKIEENAFKNRYMISPNVVLTSLGNLSAIPTRGSTRYWGLPVQSTPLLTSPRTGMRRLLIRY